MELNSNISAFWLRNKWINFFKGKGHFDFSNKSVIPSSSDKSLLFINSGVAIIKPFFCRELEPPSKRIVSCQKVIRTGDIENIGESFRHHTYFEMLGNFSIGDYFKEEAINWAWEFLVQEINLDPTKLYVTVYFEDHAAFEIWKKILGEERIILGNRETNFWDMGVGPCGPCTEIYFDKGEKYDPEGIGLDLLRKNIDNERYLEIWNIVFSEFLNFDGNIVEAPCKNIDTGAGLERLLSVLEGKDSNFQNSLFSPIVSFLKSKSSKNLEESFFWAPADYLRTTCLLLSEGVVFGNKSRDYVLRKIFRRAIYSLSDICGSSVDEGYLLELVEVIGNTLRDFYPEILEKSRGIANLMYEECRLIFKTGEAAKKLFLDLFEKYDEEIPAKEVFDLVTSHGLDFWFVNETLKRSNRKFSVQQYELLMQEHKKVSFNKNISSAFIKENESLLKVNVQSSFDYFENHIQSKVVLLLDENFQEIHKLSGFGYVILDKSVIFPVSGGQESDDGFIGGIKVLNSFKAPNGQSIYAVEGDFHVGQEVEVSHDEEKRRNLEKHHTLEHLLFELLRREFGAHVERFSGQKFHNYVNLEVLVKGKNASDFNLAEINKKLNDLIAEDLKVNIAYITLEEYKKMNLPLYFEEVYKKNSSNLRLVNIGDYSIELCAGTHISRTSLIEQCLITEFKKKQNNVYKFKLIAGFKLVQEYLCEFNKSNKYPVTIDVSNYWTFDSEEFARKSKELQKQQLIEEKKKLKQELISLLQEQDLVILQKKELDCKCVLAVFKEIRNELQKSTIFLINESLEGSRYFVVSDAVDVLKVIDYLQRKYMWKGGGNVGFGSGMLSGDSLRSDFITDLTAFIRSLV